MAESLTVEELREHVNSGLSDEALQRLLDASWEEIVARAGDGEPRTEILFGGSRFITTHFPIASIGSVSETRGDTVTTLQADDYLHRSQYVIQRLSTGTNPRHEFRGRVAVVYTPVDDEATRHAVQIDLINAMVNFQPGITQLTIGQWSEAYAANSAWNNSMERNSILSRLDPEPGMMVIG
jgi:hypothetical protein